jgi:hypothetical protein
MSIHSGKLLIGITAIKITLSHQTVAFVTVTIVVTKLRFKSYLDPLNMLLTEAFIAEQGYSLVLSTNSSSLVH